MDSLLHLDESMELLKERVDLLDKGFLQLLKKIKAFCNY